MRKEKLYINDIQESLEKIARYTKGLSFEDFSKNEVLIDAIVARFIVIGEAASHLTENTRHQFPDIPWRKIIGLRNLVVHEYFKIDLPILWKIISVDLPTTKAQLDSIIENFIE